ncbi:hypothetical protein [Natronomonas sp. EA1]
MPTCPRCGPVGTDELVRHTHGRLLVVHCPECGTILGSYRRHGDLTT